ncbi:MAG: hypothetical protein GY768_10005 [Planctomycetaceae bacterium]|nr:hypothetical protein [Planctomycetaceae bacterium]
MSKSSGKADALSASAPPKTLSSQARSIVSLLIIVHFICVLTVVMGNQYASELQIRMARVFGPYARLFYLDPQVMLGFHLTHAMEFEDDHFVEIQFKDSENRVRFPEPGSNWSGWRGGLRHHRWKMLARRLAMNVQSENDPYLAQVCEAVGRNLLGEDHDRMVVTITRRMPIELGGITIADEGGPDAYEAIYEADVWMADSGQVMVHKKVDVGEAAPLDAG